MDHGAFDRLTRFLAVPGSRRVTLAALLGAGLASAPGIADTKRGRKKHRPHPRRGRVAAQAADCLSPGQGTNLNSCDFTGENFAGADLSSSSMIGIRFNDANLCGADLSSSQLRNANFNGANLTLADLSSSGCRGVQFNAATVFCQTTTCNGNIRNDDCPGGLPAGFCCTAADCAGPGAVCAAGRCGAGCDVCPSGCRFATLHAAVLAAAPGGTIRICPGTYATNDVSITKNLTIIGAGDGPGGTILDGQRTSRVLRISTAAIVTIRDLTVTRGRSSSGGGIRLDPGMRTLTLERVHVTDNTSESGGPDGTDGGGIAVRAGATLNLIASVIANNTGIDNGGGIANLSTVTLDASHIEGNTAVNGGGGGIINGRFALLTLTNGSTVTGNRATVGAPVGGGIRNFGMVTGATATNVTGNTPDNCVNVGGTGCPA